MKKYRQRQSSSWSFILGNLGEPVPEKHSLSHTIFVGMFCVVEYFLQSIASSLRICRSDNLFSVTTPQVFFDLPLSLTSSTSYHTTAVLRPFFRDHPGEPVPEDNFCTLWCKGRLTEADTVIIRLGATPFGLTSAYLHHPPIHIHNPPLHNSCIFSPNHLILSFPSLLNLCHCPTVIISSIPSLSLNSLHTNLSVTLTHIHLIILVSAR